MRTYCPRCKTHTDHAVSLYKSGKRKGAKIGERRQARRKKGYGGQKFPLQHNQAKVSKKQTLMLECRECSYTLQRKGIRLKKAEVM
jgi:large subunit ribosomal protein L44e